MQLAKNSLLQRGKYKIVGTLGHGGFGITYLGLHVALNRKVAVVNWWNVFDINSLKKHKLSRHLIIHILSVFMMFLKKMVLHIM